MSVVHLHLDFETRSMLDIKKVGLDNYARSAEVLMMGWAINDQPPQIWLPGDPERPFWLAFGQDVGVTFAKGVVFCAWNASFERAILKHCLGFESPIEQWLDPSVLARYAGMPGKLAKVSQFLKLGSKGKDKDGTRLINKFSKPYRGKFRDPQDPKHAADWQKFQDYCRQDIVAEREIFHRLKGFFYPPPTERRLWELDAKINESGLPVSMDFTRNAQNIIDEEQEKLTAELKAITGLENPNSVQQLLPWLRERGYPFTSLGKKKVSSAIDSTNKRDKVTL